MTPFKKILRQIVGWLAPSPTYPVKMTLSGLTISFTKDGIDPETLRLLTPSDLRTLAADYCHTCLANGHGTANACLDCGPVRLFAAMALNERRRDTEAG